MDTSDLIFIAPGIRPTAKSEAEIFGAMVWLWMHSPTHQPCPIRELERLLLPALKTGQFVMALQNTDQQQPAGLMTWARFSQDVEGRYLQTLDRTLQPGDWLSGDRPWILDWVVPFGQVTTVASAVRRLHACRSFRGLYHRGDQTGLKVLYFRGRAISKAQEADFWASRPLPSCMNQHSTGVHLP